MMKNDKLKLFKNLLTTASALAMLSAAGNTYGIDITGDPFDISTGANAGGAAFAPGSKYVYTGNFSGITGDTGDGNTMSLIIGNTNPGVLTIDKAAGGGGVAATISKVTTAMNKLTVEISDNSTLVLDGANDVYKGLGSIGIAGGAANTTLRLIGNLTYKGNINGIANLVLDGNDATLGSGAGAVLTAGELKFNTANKITFKDDFTGNVDFNNQDGTMTMEDGKKITGNVDNKAGAGEKGTLEFLGNSEVTGSIGATKILKLIKASGADGKVLKLSGAVKAKELQMTSGADIQLADDTVIDKLTIGDANSNVKIADTKTLEFTGNETAIDLKGNSGHILFDGNNSALKFNSTANGAVTVEFDAALDPGLNNKGKIILNAVDNELKVMGGSLGSAGNKLREISITGNNQATVKSAIYTEKLSIAAGPTSIFTDPSAGSSTLTDIAAPGGNVTYQPTADMDIKATTFGDAASALTLKTDAANDRIFTLKDDINPSGNFGKLILTPNGKKITLTAEAGGKALGTAGNKLHTLQVDVGDSDVTALVDLTNISHLDVKNGGNLTSLTPTILAIADIKIGEGAGGGKLTVDSNQQIAIDVLNGGATISFEHADSVLKLTNNNATGAGVATTYTLKGKLVPGAATDLQGSLVLDATAADLAVAPSGAETIGTNNAERLKKVTVSGDKVITINTPIYAKNIEVSSTGDVIFNKIDGGADSELKFASDGAAKFQDEVKVKAIDFGGKTVTTDIADGKNIEIESITNGANSTLKFLGTSTITLAGAKTVTLKIIEGGANGKTATLTAGNYTREVRLLNAGGTIEAEDGFKLTGGFNTLGGVAGAVKFLGDAEVSGDLGTAGNALGKVTVAGVNKTLQLGGNVYVTSLKGAAADDQNLKFVNANDIEVHGPIGSAGKKFTKIEFNAAKKVDFKNDLAAQQELYFTADADVITTGYDLGATDITATATGAKLTVDADQTITGNIAAFGTLHVDGDKTVTIDTANFGAKLTTETDSEGTLVISLAGNDLGTIGTAGEKFKEVTFDQTRKIGDVFADNITVNANGDATFGGTINAPTIKFTDAGAEARFGAGDLNVDLISDGAGGNGIAYFEGTNIKQDVGAAGARLAGANFNLVGKGSSNIGADIYTDNMLVNGTIVLDKAVTFDGATSFDEAVIKLGEYDLTLTGGNVSFGGKSVIETEVNSGTGASGNFVAGNGSDVKILGNGTVEVKVTPTGGGLPANKQEFTLIKKDGNGKIDIAELNKIKVAKTGALVNWFVQTSNEGIKITSVRNDVAVVTAAVASTGQTVTEEITENAQTMSEALPGSQADKANAILNSFVDENGNEDKAAITDFNMRLTNTTSNETAQSAFNDLTGALDQIGGHIQDAVGSSTIAFAPAAPDIVGRAGDATAVVPAAAVSTGGSAAAVVGGGTAATGSVGGSAGTGGDNNRAGGSGSSGSDSNGPTGTKAKTRKVGSDNNYIIGLAAGDEAARYGLWATPFVSKSIKKKNRSSSGYKSTAIGGTIGFDTKVNEDTMIGLAFTSMSSDIKHRDFKIGDKTKVNTILLSAYSSHMINNHWYNQNIASIGSSYVDNQEKRRMSLTGYGIAKARYSSMMFALESSVGYNKLVGNAAVITPSFGLGYSRMNDTGYIETGSAGAQLLKINKKAAQKLDVIAGLRVSGVPYTINEVVVSPEIHASVRRDLIGKSPTVNAYIPGLQRSLVEKPKPQLTTYGVGASVKLSYHMMDYSLSVDGNFAKKYAGASGSVNVRVNF